MERPSATFSDLLQQPMFCSYLVPKEERSDEDEPCDKGSADLASLRLSCRAGRAAADQHITKLYIPEDWDGDQLPPVSPAWRVRGLDLGSIRVKEACGKIKDVWGSKVADRTTGIVGAETIAAWLSRPDLKDLIGQCQYVALPEGSTLVIVLVSYVC